MWQSFWNNAPVLVMFACIFGGGIIIAVAQTIATTWRRARESEHLAVLKQSMIDRGMSADEIERVLNAGKTT
jgi:hypothetical protein